VIHESVSLKYKPSSEPIQSSARYFLFPPHTLTEKDIERNRSREREGGGEGEREVTPQPTTLSTTLNTKLFVSLQSFPSPSLSEYAPSPTPSQRGIERGVEILNSQPSILNPKP